MAGLRKIVDKIELINLSDLVPYERNSRTHSKKQVEQIANSIEKFGFVNPLLIDQTTREIIAGHGRFQAAKKLKLEKVPVIILEHLSETERKALLIADNKISDNAGWDEDLLALELEALNLDAEFDFGVLAFDDDELEDLLGEASEVEMPSLKTGKRPDITQITLTVSMEQKQVIKDAIAQVLDDYSGEDVGNKNGFAVHRICEEYLENS